MKFKNVLIVFAILSVILFAPSKNSFSRIPVSNTLSDFIARYEPLYIALFSAYEDDPSTFRIVKFGFNLDLDAAAVEDIWSVGGKFVRPTAAQTLTVVSSSTDDDVGGTGAEEITVACIGSDGTESDIVIDMDGTTSVVTTGTDTCLFINRAKVTVAGSGTKNAGNITITQTTSGYTLAYIPATYSITQQAVYRVPSDRRCYINHMYIAADKLTGSDPRVIFLFKVFNTTVEYVLRRELLDTNTETSRTTHHFKGDALLPNEIIVIEADTDTNDTHVYAEIDLTCIEI